VVEGRDDIPMAGKVACEIRSGVSVAAAGVREEDQRYSRGRFRWCPNLAGKLPAAARVVQFHSPGLDAVRS
jgi:hypothetical protein